MLSCPGLPGKVCGYGRTDQVSPTWAEKCSSSSLSHRWEVGTLHFCPGGSLLLAGQGVYPFQTSFFPSLVFQRRGLLPGAGVRDSSTQEVATFGCLGDLAELEHSVLWSPVPRWEQCSPRGGRGAGCGGGEVSRGFPASVSAKPLLWNRWIPGLSTVEWGWTLLGGSSGTPLLPQAPPSVSH